MLFVAFLLLLFYISSVYLTFVNVINHVLYFCAWVYPVWDSAFPEPGYYFPSHVRRFSTISSPDIFSDPFSFSSSSGTPVSHMLVHLMYWRSLRLFSFFFHSFFFILFYSSDFHHSVFQVTYLFFCLSFFAIDSFFYSAFHFSYYTVHYCLFFTFSIFSLNTSVSSQSVPLFFS